MFLDPKDWPLLRPLLITMLSVILIGGMAIGGAWYFRDIMMKESNRLKAGLSQAQGKLHEAEENLRLIQEYLPGYRELLTRKLIGPELRLEWIDAIKQAATAIKLPGWHYNLAPQQPYTENPPPAGKYRIMASAMTLDLGMLHEGDLLHLLRLLNDTSHGIILPKSCNFKQMGSGRSEDPKGINVTAACKLFWITLQGDSGAPIK